MTPCLTNDPMSYCGAKKRSGGECKQPAMPNGRCRLHGGKSTGGPLLAGGRHSKYLPQRLAPRYAEALQDDCLLSVNAEIALIDTRLGELLQRLDTTETSLSWKLAAKLFRETKSADAAKASLATMQLGEVLEKGLADSQAWGEAMALIEQRRKCADTEAKRLAQLDQFITAKQANVLIAALIQLVTENVPDVDARKRIAAGLVRIGEGSGSTGDLGAGTGSYAN